MALIDFSVEEAAELLLQQVLLESLVEGAFGGGNLIGGTGFTGGILTCCVFGLGIGGGVGAFFCGVVATLCALGFVFRRCMYFGVLRVFLDVILIFLDAIDDLAMLVSNLGSILSIW